MLKHLIDHTNRADCAKIFSNETNISMKPHKVSKLKQIAQQKIRSKTINLHLVQIMYKSTRNYQHEASIFDFYVRHSLFHFNQWLILFLSCERERQIKVEKIVHCVIVFNHRDLFKWFFN